MTVLMTPQGARRPRLVQDNILLLGAKTLLARRVVRDGCWEVERLPDDTLAALLSVAYGKAVSVHDPLVATIVQATGLLRTAPFHAKALLDRLPEPSAAADLDKAERLLQRGVAPADLRKALRHEALNLATVPAACQQLSLTDQGVVLGYGTVIVPLRDFPDGTTGLAVEGHEERILALLSVARWELTDARVLEKFRSASRALRQGETGRAAIALCHVGQPRLVDDRIAKVLDAAADRLDWGVRPFDLLKGLGLLAAGDSRGAWQGYVKYSDNQPRDERGRWTDGDSGGRIRLADNRPAGTVSDVSPQKQWKQAWMGQPNEAMRVFLAGEEDPHGEHASSYGYDAVNPRTQALGRYQFLQSTLAGLGVQSKDGSWDTDFAHKYNIKTDDDFLNNESAQEKVMTLYMNDLDRQIDKFYEKYKDREFIGVNGEPIKITRAGLIAAAHRAGAGSIRDYFNAYEAGNTRGKPLGRYDKWVETRLREAQSVPYTRA